MQTMLSRPGGARSSLLISVLEEGTAAPFLETDLPLFPAGGAVSCAPKSSQN